MEVPEVFRLEGLFVFLHTGSEFVVCAHAHSSFGAHQIFYIMNNMVI
jgi:hypothetical protein